jgi:hypothetical protein
MKTTPGFIQTNSERDAVRETKLKNEDFNRIRG